VDRWRNRQVTDSQAATVAQSAKFRAEPSTRASTGRDDGGRLHSGRRRREVKGVRSPFAAIEYCEIVWGVAVSGFRFVTYAKPPDGSMAREVGPVPAATEFAKVSAPVASIV